jgi:serine/threonine protein kinase
MDQISENRLQQMKNELASKLQPTKSSYLIDEEYTPLMVREYINNNQIETTIIKDQGECSEVSINKEKGIVVKKERYADFPIENEIYNGVMCMNKLNIPNFMKVYGYDKDNKSMLAEYIEGTRLSDIEDLTELPYIMIQIISAMKMLHDKYELVHYDLNLDNIIIRECEPMDIYYDIGRMVSI